jgi:PTH1 family peptidyl-tRNA hydrolase
VCRAIAEAAPLLAAGRDASFQNKTHLAIEAAGFGEKSSA